MSMYEILIALSQYTYFYISKNIISYTFFLVFKIVENLQCIIKQSLNMRHILKVHELYKKEGNVLYSVITQKFPAKQCSCLSVKFQVKLVISVRVTLINKGSAFKASNYAGLVKCNYVELIYLILGQTLLQTVESFIWWGNFITK